MHLSTNEGTYVVMEKCFMVSHPDRSLVTVDDGEILVYVECVQLHSDDLEWFTHILLTSRGSLIALGGASDNLSSTGWTLFISQVRDE